jgi:hypothetical protein
LLHGEDDDTGTLFRLENLVEFIESFLATFGQLSETTAQFLEQFFSLGAIIALDSGMQLSENFFASLTASAKAFSSTSEPGFEL